MSTTPPNDKDLSPKDVEVIVERTTDRLAQSKDLQKAVADQARQTAREVTTQNLDKIVTEAAVQMAEDKPAREMLAVQTADKVVADKGVRDEVAARIAADPDLQKAVAQRFAFAPALENDTFPFRAAVVTFCLAILSVIVAVVVIKLVDETTAVPDVLVAIGTASVAALAGLLSPIGASGNRPPVPKDEA